MTVDIDRSLRSGTPAERHKGSDVDDRDDSALVTTGAFDVRALITSLPQAIRKLTPRAQARNPVMFVVYLGAVVTTVLAIWQPSWFAWAVAAWLWFTVVFANLAEAVAEGRGRAQADSLRKVKRDSVARRIGDDGAITEIAGSDLRIGDLIAVEAGVRAEICVIAVPSFTRLVVLPHQASGVKQSDP